MHIYRLGSHTEECTSFKIHFHDSDQIHIFCMLSIINLKYPHIITAAPDRPSQPGIAYLSVLSVTLRWTAGFNGGFRQTFSVMHRVAGRTWPDEAQITGIPDPGENREVEYKVGSLMSNTTYDFRVRAENERENGERTSQYTVTIQGKTKGV